MAKFNLGWLKDKNGEKFAPKTFLSQILNNDGSSFLNRIISIENTLKEHDNKIVNNESVVVLESRVNTLTEFTNEINESVNILRSTVSTNTENIADLTERVTQHENRYSPTQFILKDTVNGYDYYVEMQNGNLVSYGKCTGIQVTKLPDKTTGIFKPDGMIVSATTQDGSLREITGYQVSDVVNGVVTVTYTEFNQIFTTTFNTSMISVKDALIDFEYTENNDGTYTITAWKGTLNGSPSTEMVIPDSNLIIVGVN